MESKYNCVKTWKNHETFDCFRDQSCKLPGTLQNPVLLGVHQNSVLAGHEAGVGPEFIFRSKIR